MGWVKSLVWAATVWAAGPQGLEVAAPPAGVGEHLRSPFTMRLPPGVTVPPDLDPGIVAPRPDIRAPHGWDLDPDLAAPPPWPAIDLEVDHGPPGPR